MPVSSASFDDNGVAVPGSFDPSGLEDEDEENKVVGPRIPRLIMRQENTHRVILNTVILRGTAFTDKPGTSTAQIMFTAIEGDKEPKPVSMILKVIALVGIGVQLLISCRCPKPMQGSSTQR